MLRIVASLLFLLSSLSLWAQEETYEGKVVVIQVGEDSLVNKQCFKFWKRTLARVNEEKAKAVIFQLDTPGGLAFDTKDLMVQELRDLEVPSYAFVDDEAISAGAMISIACDEIWMTPGSTIGAAAIVNGTGQPIEETMRAKLESFFDANIRAVTQDKGHPTEVVKMMMFMEDRTRKYGPIRVSKNQLLTLTAEEAVQEYNGKPILAKGLASSRDELIEKLGMKSEEVVEAKQTGFEILAWHVSAWSGLLILIGIGGIYFEMKSPGFGLGAGVAALAFGTFFFGNFVAGNLAGYELIALFVLGLLFVIAEVTLFPSLILGLLGTCMMIGSLLFAMVDKIDFERIGSDNVLTGEEFSIMDTFYWPLISLSLGLIGGIILMFVLMKYLPKMPIPGFVLQREIGAGVDEEMMVEKPVDDLVGEEGVAIMDLRPVGKMALGDKRLDVISSGEFIQKGTKIRIIAQEQMRIVVETV